MAGGGVGPFPHYLGAPDVVASDTEAIRQGLQQAYAAVERDQQEARVFMDESGAAVSSGHPNVRAPGRQGDPSPGVAS